MFPQILKVCSVNFSKPNLDSSTMQTVAVNETTAASGTRDSERCHTFV